MLMQFTYSDDVAEDAALADARTRWDAKCVERGRSTDTDVRVAVEPVDEGGFVVVMNDGTADIQ